MRCPFCGGRMEFKGRIEDLSRGRKLPFVGDVSKLMPSELRELEVYVCGSCGFVALFKSKGGAR